MQNDLIIKKLKSDRFGSFVKWVDGADGHLNPVFVATIRHPTQGILTAYCKIYPIGQTERGLINEITGYLFAHAFGVPQPEFAFVTQLPVSVLIDIESKFGADHWLLKQSIHTIFCTTRLDGESAAIYFSAPNEELNYELSKWADLNKTVALDENIAHTDRHFNNIMRLRRNQFAAIDNGRLVSEDSESWTKEMLNHEHLYRNRLSEHLWNHKPDKQIVSKMLHVAQEHLNSIKLINDELIYWIKGLISSPIEQEAFYQFLQQRTGATPWLIQKRYQHLV